MKYFITADELKASNVLNANLEVEYIEPAIREAQNIFLREILGDSLYKEIETYTDNYTELLNDYAKPYLEYKVQSILCLSVSFKIRNAGVVNQYGTDFNSTQLNETKYLQAQLDNKAEFFENRLKKYLQQNDLYVVACDDITKPTTSQTAGSIYLGKSKKSCGCVSKGGGNPSGTMDYNQLINKPSINGQTLIGNIDIETGGVTKEEVEDMISEAIESLPLNFIGTVDETGRERGYAFLGVDRPL